MKKAFITGISGQDGSYLSELLLSKGYEVHGLIRRNSVAENQTQRIEKNRNKINLHYGDLTDLPSLLNIFIEHKFSEVYNLGAMSNVGISFECPIYTQEVNYLGFINLMEAIIKTNQKHSCKVYQASSSEMFGNECDSDGFQRETTPMIPVSPYGISKLSAHRYAQHLRRAYGIWISCGILFNHESPRRGTNFVTGKVAKAVALISMNKQKELSLGNLNSFRDWGHSKDYIKVMWQMLNEVEEPDDFICCTGETHSVKDLCDISFKYINKDYQNYVKIDSKYIRDEELDYLRGCSDKLKSKINVEINYSFKEMIYEMIDFHIHNNLNSNMDDYFKPLAH
jgi:GDPmannose 4,6-dehydratase